VSISAFHEFCRNRQKHGHTLNATSTHDTKRAEDVRARINALSELAGTWEESLQRWTLWNRPRKIAVNGEEVPGPNAEFLLYQTMLGAWPLEASEVSGFRKRLQDYMVKAAREARVHTKWDRPNARYEQALIRFIKAITEPSEDNVFLRDFLQMYREVAYYGAINSLAQVLLKITVPGIPDFYQGSDLWDFRLVDPDNRGPVDFAKRVRVLAELQQQDGQGGRLDLIQDLLDHWQDGRIKLFLISKALNFRRAHDPVFLDGAYQPLQATSARKENVFAFLRHTKDAWTVVAVPRLVTKLAPAGQPPTGENAWGAEVLRLSAEAPREWLNVLSGEKVQASGSQQKRTLPLAQVFSKFPVALLAAG